MRKMKDSDYDVVLGALVRAEGEGFSCACAGGATPDDPRCFCERDRPATWALNRMRREIDRLRAELQDDEARADAERLADALRLWVYDATDDDPTESGIYVGSYLRHRDEVSAAALAAHEGRKAS